MPQPSHPLAAGEAWRDRALTPRERAADLIGRMTLDEKLAQLVGVWVGADASGGGVAPHQADLAGGPLDWQATIRDGLGQLTRPYGSAPVDPAAGARSLEASQTQIVAASRFGIPAIVHEECLAGFAAWQATAYPVPLSWGASFDPELVREMAGRIGRSMRAAGVHQGLAPVLDVTRDYRWGRTEETISEDPYLVGAVGAAYVAGLESTGIIATLKHFAGYSASRAARNLAPVSMGSREFADVILPPFEAALRHGGARSVMHSYADVDGVPAAADRRLLTELLRDEWGFEGTVVADYFGVRFLEKLHRVAGDGAEAAGLALEAGVDVELPTIDAFGAPLREAVQDGRVPESLVDRALLRVLEQKISIGLLDDPSAIRADANPVLDDDASRELARRLARESLVLLENRDALPLAPTARLAVVGPLADEASAMLGCYSFPAHVGSKHPEVPIGIAIPTVLESLRAAGHEAVHAAGSTVDTDDRSGFAAAVEAARGADVAIAVVGDRAGLFGRGTSGEGCDAADLRLPGVQRELIEALLETGTPVVIVLLTGRPYALGGMAERAAAVLQGFFPGQEGGPAIAEILTGAVSPSGRLPVGIPRDAGSQPGTYLSAPLGQRSGVSNIDPTPLYPFGHGLGYSRVEWSEAEIVGGGTEWPVDGAVEVAVTLRNAGDRPAADVVQLYAHDPVAQVTRPVQRLIGFQRVELQPGESARVVLHLHADLLAFTGLAGRRVVEPGAVQLRVARSSAEVVTALDLVSTGPLREVGHDRELLATATVETLEGALA